MTRSEPLVSVGLPVRNGADQLEVAALSVLAQSHRKLELIISDNASDDSTESVCRRLARADVRVRYHRQPENIGLLNNFLWVIGAGQGRYFQWIGHNDRLEPTYLERCVERFESDERLVLVTTQLSYTELDGLTRTATYDAGPLGSDRPVERFAEMLRLLNESYLSLDPLYGLNRRQVINAIPRRNMLREDQVFAAKMALAGPWAHVPEVLAHREWADEPRDVIARLLDVPHWQARCAILLQCRELLSHLEQVPLNANDRRVARTAVRDFYIGTVRRRAARRARRLASLGAAVLRRPALCK